MLILVKAGKWKSTDGLSRHLAPGELCFARDFALHLKCCLEVLDRRALEHLLQRSILLVPQLCCLPLLFCVLGPRSSEAGFDSPIQLCTLCFIT